MSSFRGYLFILGAALFWGGSAVIAKLLLNQNIPPFVLVQMRVTFSFLLIAGFYLVFKRDLLRVRTRDLYRFALLGVIGVAGANFTYYFTIHLTNVSTAILIQYTAPLLVVGYGALTREEHIGPVKVIAAAVSLAGCYFALGGTQLSLPNISVLGLVSGIGSAVCWAFTNVYLRHLLKDYKVWTVLTYSFLFATFFWFFFMTPWQFVQQDFSVSDWLMFVGFAAISVLIPHSLYFIGMQYIVPSRAIVTATFEPVVVIVGSFLILGDSMTPVQIFGAVLVMTAIAILQMKREEGNVISHPEQQS